MPAIDCNCEGNGLYFEGEKKIFCGCIYGQRIKAINRDAGRDISKLIWNWYNQASGIKDNDREAFVNYSMSLEEIITNKQAWVLPYVFKYFKEKNLDIVYQGVVYDVENVESIIKLLKVLKGK